MKKIIAIFILSIVIGCAEKEPTTSIQKTEIITVSNDQESKIPVRVISMYDLPLTDRNAALDNPYELSYSIETNGENKFTLVSTIKLFGGSFYVSPHSTTEFKGRFTIDIVENKHIIMGENFVETPRSQEEIDLHRFVNGPVNWVDQDTKYEHPVTLKTDENFDVHGKFIFTIEPKCTLEEIPFVIKHRDGVLKIEKWQC